MLPFENMTLKELENIEPRSGTKTLIHCHGRFLRIHHGQQPTGPTRAAGCPTDGKTIQELELIEQDELIRHALEAEGIYWMEIEELLNVKLPALAGEK